MLFDNWRRIEEAFGWAKCVGPLRKTKLRGLAGVDFQCVLTFAGYNLMRMRMPFQRLFQRPASLAELNVSTGVRSRAACENIDGWHVVLARRDAVDGSIVFAFRRGEKEYRLSASGMLSHEVIYSFDTESWPRHTSQDVE